VPRTPTAVLHANPKNQIKRTGFSPRSPSPPPLIALGSWSGVPAALLPPVSSEEAANSMQESGEKATTQPPTSSFTAISIVFSSKIDARQLFCLLVCLFPTLGEK
jgi:hypothetical protein